MANMSEEEFETLIPPSILMGEDQYKDFSFKGILTSREKKGFRFEVQNQRVLYEYGLSFEGNPINVEDWKRSIGEGVDIKVFYKGLKFNIECKYLNSIAYPSYIKRDYLPRFNGLKGINIVVTNNKWRLTYNARRLLKAYNIKLLNSYELVSFIINYVNKILKGNKYIMNSKTYFCSSSCNVRPSSCCDSVIAHVSSENNTNSRQLASGYSGPPKCDYETHKDSKHLNFKEYQNTIEKINKAICDIVKYRLIELDPREYFDIHLSNPNLPSIVNEENFWYFVYKTVDHYTWNSLIDLSKYCANNKIGHSKIIELGYNTFIKRVTELLFNMSPEYEDEKLEIPSCRLCKKFKHCTILDDLKRLKCLKRRVYLQEHYDNEDKEYSIILFHASFSEEDFKEFWNRVRVGEFKDLIKPYNNGDLLYYINGDG